jgi:serine/threonine protein kinase
VPADTKEAALPWKERLVPTSRDRPDARSPIEDGHLQVNPTHRTDSLASYPPGILPGQEVGAVSEARNEPATDASPAPRASTHDADSQGRHLVSGSIEHPDEYELIGQGHKGGEGVVFRARYQGNLPRPVTFAVKQLLAPPGLTPADWPDERLVERWKEQLKLLHLVHHDHLVGYRELFYGWPPHPEGSCHGVPPAELGTWYLVMDWVEGSSLHELVRREEGTLLERLGYIAQLASAVEYLHSGSDTAGMTLLHRDIKPGNAIVHPVRGAVLVDCGLLRVEEPTPTELPAWTGPYLAPEVHADKSRTSRSSDVWALAATAFFSLTGEQPSPFDPTLMRSQINDNPTGLLSNPPAVAEAIMSVLDRPPGQRPKSPVVWTRQLIGTCLDAVDVPPTPTSALTAPVRTETVAAESVAVGEGMLTGKAMAGGPRGDNRPAGATDRPTQVLPAVRAGFSPLHPQELDRTSAARPNERSTRAVEPASPLAGGRAHRRPRTQRLSVLLAAIVLVGGGAGAAAVLLGRPSSSPTGSVANFVAAVNSHETVTALRYIDPADRSERAVSGGLEALDTTALGTLHIRGFRVTGQSIQGSHAWVTVTGDVCTENGCHAGVGLLIAFSTAAAEPGPSVLACELVNGTWYVYAGHESWAREMPSTTSGSPTAPKHKSHFSRTSTTVPLTQINFDGVTIGVSSVASDPDVTSVADTLATYFGGIDSQNYSQAWDVYTTSLQAKVPFQAFSQNDSTTDDTQISVERIQQNAAGELDATVSFQSTQAAQYAYATSGETCTDWSIDYQLLPSLAVQAGSSGSASSGSSASSPLYQINEALPEVGNGTPC